MRKHSDDTKATEHQGTELKAELSFYHLCVRCGAKWFVSRRKSRCPRCGKASRSEVQMLPPWLRSMKSAGE